MKNIFISLFLLIILFSTIVSAAESPGVKRNTSDNTIQSLMLGLNSDNFGLKTGSAYMLGELKVTDAVIPLMRMMRNDESEQARIVAALALYKLGTPMSIHALFQAARFDDNKRVRKMCSGFYLNYISKHKVTEI
ncbi:MAG: HEAT repeat domain-containing protein [Ignavibacteria bacterium]|nr:HEAT repeat domain-containing protein [Ignavibacteria bacterium]